MRTIEESETTEFDAAVIQSRELRTLTGAAVKRCVLLCLSLMASLLMIPPVLCQNTPAIDGPLIPPPGEARTEVELLVDTALGLPPEYAANILMRLTRMDGISITSKQRQNLLEEVFKLAPGVELPYPRLFAGPDTGINANSMAREAVQAETLGLDMFSLQSAVVQSMLSIDRRRARELFDLIPAPSPREPSCDSLYIDNVYPIYRTLGLIVRQGFSPEERQKGLHVELIASRLRGVGWAGELDSAAGMLALPEWSDQDFLTLLPIYTDRLRSAKHYLFLCALHADITLVSFDDRVQTFLRRAKALGSGAEDLVLAYREYLIKRLGANRCDGRSCKTYDNGYIPMALKLFNEETRGLAGVPVPAITKEDVAKFSVLPSKVRLESPDGDAAAQKIQQQISRLRFGFGETYKADGLSTEQRREAGWQKEAQRLLREIEAWPGVRPGAPEAVFHRKINMYESLLGACPAGSLRDQVLRSHVSFLAYHRMETAHPIEWLRWADRLLHPNYAPLKSIPKTQILDLWSVSGDPVLGAYATLERLADPTPRAAQ